MTPKTRIRARWFAAILFTLGATVFVTGQPSRLPEEQVTAAKAQYETWLNRHNEDIRNGRRSSAGPPPSVETHTPTSRVLVVLGFLLVMAGILVLTISLS